MTKASYMVWAFVGLWVAGSPARADVADSFALQVDGSGVSFAIRVNGLPVGVLDGRPLAGAAFLLDSLLHPGTNEVVVSTHMHSPSATLQLTLTAPSQDPFTDGTQLGHVQCGFALPDGSTPACVPDATYRLTLQREPGPDLALWHAEAGATGREMAAAISEALRRDRTALVTAARGGDWARLFYGDAPRAADLRAAGGAQTQEADMAKFMEAAARAHPRQVEALDAPGADELTLTELPSNLLAVTRRDGRPVIRIQVGNGTIPGSDQPGQDPDDFGDYADKFHAGVFQQTTVIVGRYDGAWRRIR